MSENFPFDTPEELLAKSNPEEPIEVTLHTPSMPSLTRTQQASLGTVAALAFGAFNDSSDAIKMTGVICVTIIISMMIIGDAIIRKARNERIMSENTQTIESSADVAMHNAE